ncbi:MAG: methionine--tRNA ligase subunit beta, partial [Lachnospiraceae bacterium]|nr:methionine--tRNA ligase subunit beta [Lachnospiraceae bacterium]
VVERTNADLANTLGNLVNRTVSMSNKYFDGVVSSTGVTGPEDEDLKAVATGALARVTEKMDVFRVADAISEIFTVFKRCNKFIDETMPWALAKDESKKDRLSEVLYNLTEAITIGASLLSSFLPRTADKILKQLNTTLRPIEDLGTFGLYPNETKVTDKPEILFARLDWKEIEPKVKAIQEAQKAEYEAEQARIAKNLGKELPAPETSKPEAASSENDESRFIDIDPKAEITYDDFAKLQFRVGVIEKCEEVPKSKKLLCSQVRVGSKTLQIVSGIKKNYSPEQMVGKHVMVLTNLKPATLAGLTSEGMLLCAEDENGELALMTPEGFMPSGAEIC